MSIFWIVSHLYPWNIPNIFRGLANWQKMLGLSKRSEILIQCTLHTIISRHRYFYLKTQYFYVRLQKLLGTLNIICNQIRLESTQNICLSLQLLINFLCAPALRSRWYVRNKPRAKLFATLRQISPWAMVGIFQNYWNDGWCSKDIMCVRLVGI